MAVAGDAQHLRSGFPFGVRDRGLVFRASTSAEIGHRFIGKEYRRWHATLRFPHSPVDLLDFFPHPAHTGDLDFTIRGNPENRRHIGQAIRIRYWVGIGVVEQYGKGQAIFFYELTCMWLVILRDAYHRHLLVPMRLVNPLQKGEGILANWA